MPYRMPPIGHSGEMIQDPNWRPEGMRVFDLPKTDRAQMLDACSAFVEGRQHNHYQTTWDGNAADPGIGYLRARLRPKGFIATNAVPYGMRQPNASWPLPRQIVMRFSEMTLGHGRRPTVRVKDDLRTEAYLRTVLDESDAWDSLVELRDISGSCGSAALSVSVLSGVPTCEAHHPANLYVEEWDVSQPGWIPLTVVEQRKVSKMEIEDGDLVEKQYWRTRRWTSDRYDADGKLTSQGMEVRYKDVPIDHEGPIPADAWLPHGAGRCPVIWHQNTRSEVSPEGTPDLDGCYHLCDRLDRLQSMIVQGAIANVNPTLVRSDERRGRQMASMLRKGHGAVIELTEKGRAHLLEISGSSIEMGWASAERLRDEILQTAGCVVVDPTNTAAHRSGEALQVLWRSMESRCNRLRSTLGDTIRQICAVWIAMGRSFGVGRLDLPGSGGILLPPQIRKPDTPEPAELPEEQDGIIETHEVGQGVYVDLAWPPYHDPTAMQLQSIAGALAAATGGKPTLSQRSAVGVLSGMLGQQDAGDEYKEIMDQDQRESDAFVEEMLGDADLEDDEDDEDEKVKQADDTDED